jgi:hypothetical protein
MELNASRPLSAAEAEIESLVEQLQAAQQAPEPGAMQPGTVVTKIISEEGENLPLPMLIDKHSKSAGYTYVYDTLTGDRSVVNNNMLPSAVRKLRPNDPSGRKMFSTLPPRDRQGNVLVPYVGTHKCRLHADDPERAKWDAMGLPVCGKANLKSSYEVTTHMEHRHRMEWKAIKEDQERAEKEEQRRYQQAVIAAAARGVMPEVAVEAAATGRKRAS